MALDHRQQCRRVMAVVDHHGRAVEAQQVEPARGLVEIGGSNDSARVRMVSLGRPRAQAAATAASVFSTWKPIWPLWVRGDALKGEEGLFAFGVGEHDDAVSHEHGPAAGSPVTHDHLVVGIAGEERDRSRRNGWP